MILSPHLLFGAAIGQSINNLYIAIVLAFLSHYILDIIPHAEYDFGIRDKKHLKQKFFSVFKIALDICTAFLLIFILSKNLPIIYACMFFSILPDGLTVLNNHTDIKFLKWHQKWHEKTHFLKHKKISSFWRVFSQIIIAVISIIVLTKF